MDKQYPEPFKPAPQDEGWIDEYAPKDKAEADYFHGRAPETPVPTSANKSKKRRWPWMLGVVLLLGIITLAYFWVNSREAEAPAPIRATTTAPKQAVEVPTKHYDTTNFSFGIDYPETWKLVDTAAKLQVVSPEMQMIDASNKQVSGRLVLSVRPKQTALSEFSAGAAAAVLESTKLAYSKPTPNQRAQTYLSFLEYFSAPKNSLSALYLTGDNGYQVGQNVPQADIVKSDPLVSVNFQICPTDDCAGTPALVNVGKAWWQKQSVVQEQVQKMLTSLSFD